MKDLDKRLNEIQAELTELRKMVEHEQPYIPKPGEVVEVWDEKLSSRKRIFDEYINDSYEPYKCVDRGSEENYKLGKDYATCTWPTCRPLKGEIIEFGCDKVNEPYPTAHASMKFEIDLTNPKSEIKAEITTPDYTHLLPEGYEFCKEEEAESWVKVECPDSNEPHSPIGSFVDIEDMLLFREQAKSMYRPIRLIQTKPNPYAVDWSSAPYWADVHAFDGNREGYWYGIQTDHMQWAAICEWDTSGFTLPSGLDWKQSKTRRLE